MAATKDQVAQIIVTEAKARGYTREETRAIMSMMYQESRWDETIWGPSGKKITYGIAQQDGSYPNRFNGAAAQIKGFFDKFDVWRRKPGASGDIWLDIAWMQQAPNWESAAYWYANGRRAYLTEIKQHIDTVTPYLDKYWPSTTGGTVAVSGDPVWLEDVLRPALGDRLRTLPGWKTDGVGGTMKEIWGIMWHHTGNSNEKPESISVGRPDLRGPLAQIHIAPSGIVTIVAVGPCNHAGLGSYPGLPTNNANQYTIGIECAWPTPRKDLPLGYDPNERWPDAQIISMRDVGAAITKYLGFDASRNISHKEWAGAAQGKWDPGNLDMNWFRGEIQKDMDGFVFPGETPGEAPQQPGPILAPDYTKEVWDQLRIEWPQLGGRTLVDAVAAIGEKLGIPGCYDVKAKTKE
ncbi:endolysin [Mycobacterium phage Dylan]|uniref:LysA n=1 Tax=Mycobacterium phage Dylan TaxID=1340831 RepID=S5YLN8_9CAUD|nr:endolysin [Mycobacterium phage Dylan]AGT20696.1 LysA [Mycobacterium phage Dylan]ALA48907.1 lysin A [Mycobacterium phage Zakhe101]